MAAPASSLPLVAPFILGRGGAGQAIARALACLAYPEAEFAVAAPTWLARDVDLSVRPSVPAGARPVLFVANPHGLHAPALLAADRAGYAAIFCEKPACVSAEQLAALAGIRTPTAVFHGYRTLWGPRTIRGWIAAGRLGEIVAIEGRYWQASAAARALAPAGTAPAKSWKSDPRLAGEYDVFLDLGTHWVDLAAYLYGETPAAIRGWRSTANGDGPTRDTHVQLSLEFPGGGRGFASVSKTVHGATNGLEIHVIGTRGSAAWNFLAPDEIVEGTGRERNVVVRQSAEIGARLPPYHGLGWVDGYVETIRQGIGQYVFGRPGEFPKLDESLTVLRAMFRTQWDSN